MAAEAVPGQPRKASLSVVTEPGMSARVHDFVTGFARREGVSGDDAARFLVMLEELLTNLDKYGSGDRPGTAEITLILEDGALTVEVLDDGGPFDPFGRELSDLDRPLEERPVGGVGLHLLRELSHEASYSRADGRNLVRLMRRVAVTPTSRP